jgi:hypothetical protein
MLKAKKYLLLFVVLVKFGSSQTTFKYGAEFGYAFPKPFEHPYESSINRYRGDLIIVTRTNETSPVFGLAGDLLIEKHLRFSVGAQYQTFGCHYKLYRDGNDLYRKAKYTVNESIDQKFTKLCFPLTIGYSLKIWKFSPTLFVGLRPNYILTGNYSSTYTSDHDLDSLDYYSSYAFNPFDLKETSAPAKRLMVQRVSGVSVFVGKCIKLSYSRNAGGYVNYRTNNLSCFVISCPNFDHVFSVTFFLPQKKKSNTECILVHPRNRNYDYDQLQAK